MFYNRLYNRLCTIIYNLTNLEGSLPRLEHVGNMLEHLCSIASVEVQNGANANEIYITRERGSKLFFFRLSFPPRPRRRLGRAQMLPLFATLGVPSLEHLAGSRIQTVTQCTSPICIYIYNMYTVYLHYFCSPYAYSMIYIYMHLYLICNHHRFKGGCTQNLGLRFKSILKTLPTKTTPGCSATNFTICSIYFEGGS